MSQLSYVRLAVRDVSFPAHSENALISFPTREKTNRHFRSCAYVNISQFGSSYNTF